MEKAIAKTEPDPTPLTTAFLTELLRTEGGRKRNWPAQVLLNGRTVSHSAVTINAIALTAMEPLVTDEEMAKLHEIQSRMEANIEEAKKYSLGNVDKYLFSLRDKMAADVDAGKPLPDVVVTPSREAVSRDFIAKQRALSAQLVKWAHEELAPLVRPIIDRFAQTVDTFMRETEIHDRTLCESYGLEFVPSQLWQVAAAISMRYTKPESRMPAFFTYGTPRQILEGIVNL